MENNKRLQYGKFLVQFKRGKGFGELSFQADGNHTPRNAGIVSDGLGLIEAEFNAAASPIQQNATRAVSGVDRTKSDVCVLLLVPEACWMKEMFALHASKNQMNSKVAFLKKSFLFSQWSNDQIVKLAYQIKKREMAKGDVLAKQGDSSNVIFLIIKGRIKVRGGKRRAGMARVLLLTPRSVQIQVSSESVLKDSDGSKVGVTTKVVEIAELGENDIFGLVETYENKRKMMRTGMCVQSGEVFICTMSQFSTMVAQVPKTLALVEKVVQKRRAWEKLRAEYASNFPSMKVRSREEQKTRECEERSEVAQQALAPF